MTDPTELARRGMVPEMPTELDTVMAAGGKIWNPEDLLKDFEVLGFMAPLVTVRRRSDGVLGSLKFNHQPRVYFGWESHDPHVHTDDCEHSQRTADDERLRATKGER